MVNNMASNHSAPLFIQKTGTTGWLVFNRPDKQNAITFSMWRDIPRLVKVLDNDTDVRIIALRGAGDRAFSAGADIAEFDKVRSGADAGRNYDAANDAAFRAVAGAAKPTIAMINGFCLGGGLALALNCDLRLASSGASFAIPAAKLGVGYAPHWVHQLVSIVGPAHAKEIFFSGERLGARRALHMGLVNRVVDEAELADETARLMAQIAQNAPLTIHAIKAAIDAYAHHDHDKAHLQDLAENCYDSADFIEGRKAFLDKRKPVFKGT
jgi:enoyl-CoA hydratase/carnithine racemase